MAWDISNIESIERTPRCDLSSNRLQAKCCRGQIMFLMIGAIQTATRRTMPGPYSRREGLGIRRSVVIRWRLRSWCWRDVLLRGNPGSGIRWGGVDVCPGSTVIVRCIRATMWCRRWRIVRRDGGQPSAPLVLRRDGTIW